MSEGEKELDVNSEEFRDLKTHLNPDWDNRVSEEIRRRLKLMAWAESSPKNIGAVRKSIRDGKQGLIEFAQDWVWTFDPRNDDPKPKHLPMLLWKKQVEFLEFLYECEEKGENGLCDKSRDTGITWMVSIYMVWRWITKPGWVGSIGSRKKDLLDLLGDPKSVFWKLEFIIDELPVWLKPVGFVNKKHRSQARIINPETKAVLAGELGEEMGRGGRSSLYFLDEFGKMTRAKSVLASVSGNTNCVIYVSTAVPPGTEFHRLAHDPYIKRFRITWADDPRRKSTWRQWHLMKYGPMITAQEVDVDYGASVSNSVIPAIWVNAAVGLDLGDPDEYATITAGLDVSDTGADENVLTLRRGPYMLFQDQWQGINTTDTAHRAYESSTLNEASKLRYDSGGVGAGVRGALDTVDGDCEPVAVNFGWKPTETIYSDFPDMKARERFGNLRAEMYWNLRVRFEKTWHYVERHTGWENIPKEDMISIPDDSLLIAQLSSTQIVRGDGAKIYLESKKSMRSRGLASPDRADSLVLAYADMIGNKSLLMGFI